MSARGLLAMGAIAIAFMASHGGSASVGGSATCRHLERLWDSAGGDPSDAETMASIAMAESSGDQYATNPQTGAEGYWQIEPAVWPSLATYDALGNARAAVIIVRRQGLSAWATYTSGAYAGRC